LSQSKNILIAPLNWGLGHATRCIPLIRKYIAKGDNVIIASDGQALELLKKEFPGLTFEKLPSYNIHYGTTSFLTKVNLLSQVPKIWKVAQQEKKVTAQLVNKHNIDLIISDNRFGVISKEVKSVYITHQLRVLSGLTTQISTFFHRQVYKQYDEIWVPDFEKDGGLSGRLGHLKNSKLNIKYIGVLSRLKKQKLSKKYDILAILSGVEPQRSILEKELLQKLAGYQGKTALVQGVVSENMRQSTINNIDIYNFLTADKLENILNESEIVISRSGYTSLMDYYILNKKILIIPTPGQNEQVYLGQYFEQKGLGKCQKQSEISL